MFCGDAIAVGDRCSRFRPGQTFMPVPVAPIASDPFVPVVSTPLKMTVSDAATLLERVAVTVTLLSGLLLAFVASDYSSGPTRP